MNKWRLAARLRTGIRIAVVTALLLYAAGPFHSVRAITDVLPNRQLLISSSASDATNVHYVLSFDILTPGTLGSIEAEFCQNDPFIGTPCTAPPGFNIGGSTLDSQSGTGDFTIDTGNSNAYKLVLTRTPSAVGALSFSFTFSGVHNPTPPGSYYIRLQTFASNDATGPNTDKGGVAFSIVDQVIVTTEVPPIITFCTALVITSEDCSDTTGDTIDYGLFASTSTSAASSQFVVGTNAPYGYSVTVAGTTLTAGNDIIPAMATAGPSQIGVSQFGINLTKNTLPDVGADPDGPGVGVVSDDYDNPNIFLFHSGDLVASHNDSENFRKYTVSYITNVSKAQPPGVYATTISYICLGNF